MIPDNSYGTQAGLAPQLASPVTQAMMAFNVTHEMLDTLNGIINSAIGEEPPQPTNSLSKESPNYDGQLGELSRSSLGIRDRVEYTQCRLSALQRAITLMG